MVSSIGSGAANLPSTYRDQVSGSSSTTAASAVDGTSATGQDKKQVSSQSGSAPAGVSVSISPEGAAAAARDSAVSRRTAATGASDSTSAGGSTGSADAASGDAAVGDASAGDAAAGDAVTANGTDGSADGTSAAGGDAPSGAKSLVYGALGLERPDQPKKDENEAYSVGRWIAAGVTVASLAALLL